MFKFLRPLKTYTQTTCASVRNRAMFQPQSIPYLEKGITGVYDFKRPLIVYYYGSYGIWLTL
jgi:hypothetical protein